jgi:hypothetical protein
MAASRNCAMPVLHCTEGSLQSDATGQQRPISGVRAMSASPPKPTKPLHYGRRRIEPDLPIGA